MLSVERKNFTTRGGLIDLIQAKGGQAFSPRRKRLRLQCQRNEWEEKSHQKRGGRMDSFNKKGGKTPSNLKLSRI